MANWHKTFIILFLLCSNCFAGEMIINPYQFAPGGGGGGGTVTWRATANGTANPGTTVTVTTPTGTASGDAMVASILSDSDQDITASGWTLIGTQITASSSRLALFYRILSASPDANYDFTVLASIGLAGTINTFEKTAGTFSIGTAGKYGSNTGTGTAVTSSSVNVPYNSSLLVSCGNDDIPGVDTAPADMVSRNSVISVNSIRLYDYTQDYTTGNASVSKGITWAASGDMTIYSVVVEAN